LNDFGRPRELEADRFGGLEIDGQVEFGRKADRQVARLCPMQDAVDIGRGLLEEVDGREFEKSESAAIQILPILGQSGCRDACFFSAPCTPAVSDLAHITTGG
jgi:hypothetical protein